MGAYKVLVGKSEWKKPLERLTHKWVDNIKMDLQEVGRQGMDWIDLAQDRNRWQALVNVLMNFPQKLQGISWLLENQFASQEWSKYLKLYC